MANVFDPEVDNALQTLIDRLPKPIREALAVAREHKFDTTQTMGMLVEILRGDPSLATAVTEAMAATALIPVPDVAVAPMDEPERTPAVIPSPTGRGLPRLNPVYEGALVERLQFDGDAPEFRSGPLPLDASPAVPVATQARNPVVVGVMLGQARADVRKEADANEQRLIEEVIGTTAIEKAGLSALVRDRVVDPEGYERGRLPLARRVEEPEGAALLALSPAEEAEAAWLAISTTQGRRIQAPVVAEVVVEHLRTLGIQATVGKPSAILSTATWTVDIYGKETAPPDFSPIDAAGAAIARHLGLALDVRVSSGEDLLVEVAPVNALAQRKVGWSAKIGRRK